MKYDNKDLFSRLEKDVRSIYRFAIFGWIIGFIIWAAAVGAVGYIAWHFISKFW